MTGESTIAVSLKDVTFSYDGARQVLNGISFDVTRGERILVLGRNGSGKSTLVKILGALQFPTQGACFVCGYDVADGNALMQIRKKVSMVFQNPESQIVAAIVEDDAAFALENQGLPPDAIEARISWALEKTGLMEKRRTLSSALSGGEKQRLALAGVLATGAECMILDEPVAMLDPEGCAQVEALLRELHASGMTVVQVSHCLEEVADADRVLVLSAGRLLWQGSREDFWDRAESLGFDLPPLPTFRRRLAKKGIMLPEGAGAKAEDFLTEDFFAEAFRRLPAERLPRGPAVPAEKEKREETREEPSLSPPYFEIRSLSYSYNAATPVETRVLQDVSCAMPMGCWTSVLGRTGSGKTTLVQHLNGLVLVQAGEILIRGRPLPQAGPELRELRRKVGLVFQSPEMQLFSPTVREELEFAPRNWGFSKEEINAGVARAMESVGLGEEYLDRNPLRLSGGERRLVAVASVLSSDPECLVLDEPTAGLDMWYRKKIVALLSRLRAAGKTVVIVTHDLETAFAHSDRLLALEKGIRMCEGSVRATLPTLMAREGAFVPPEIMRISEALRCRRPDLNIPLTWDTEELCAALGL